MYIYTGQQIELNNGIERKGGKVVDKVSCSIGRSGEESPRRQYLRRNLTDPPEDQWENASMERPRWASE